MNQIHPNVALIQRFFQAYVNNDMDGIKAVLSPSINWVIPGSHPLSGTKTGIDEVIHYFAQLSRAAFSAEPLVMGANEHYVIDCHRNWSNRQEGSNLDNLSCLLWKIDNGQIVEVINFPQDQHQVDAFFTEVYG